MTYRDPNNTDFMRKVIDYYDCMKKYFVISDSIKLQNDINRKDIDLVCYYDLNLVIKHSRDTHGLNYNDFVKLTPPQEREFLSKLE